MVHDDLVAGDVREDPHTYFDALRAEDPVHWNARHRAWILTRYDDVLAAFRDPRLSSQRLSQHLPPEVAVNLTRWMVFLDPPDHTRLRRLVAPAFSPAAVHRFRPRVEEIVDGLLARLTGEVDWVRVVCEPLPAIVIAELLGVPASDRNAFLGWSADIGRVVFGAVYRPDRYQDAARSLRAFDAYFRRMIDGRRPGLVASMAAAADAGGALSVEEVVATSTMLLFAGHETTTTLLAAGLWALLTFPTEFDKIRADPGLVQKGVEEMLRYEGPTGMMVRRAVEGVEIGGKVIAAGDRVFLGVAAANHDPSRFADPHRFDIERPEGSNLGFGFGIHHCLGAPLARLEAEVVFTALAHRDVQLAGPPRWSSSVMGRSLSRLPVVAR